ncbi:MAG: tRNA (adenosine(37)-N6)-threonylcarbamoyltransferase complex dimerization subunit type 1 TsaB [Lachnospiraceae bacterium]|nr:tRNA (adenosine(37)-N6)-threonylcarbamoyltransferase complex dimerization subunit type 1 TsaB [Lachnospiraceae bacterium]
MKILAIDSSGLVASAALVEDEILKAEYSVNNRLTHSQTLMVMVDEVMRMAEWKMTDLDLVAAAMGPGSFTGLRIGVGAAKGFAHALNLPVAPVSTLDAMAYGVFGYSGVICPMLDARRSQVYTGLYSFSDDASLQVLKEPCAVPIEEIAEEINRLGRRVMLTGDGVPVYREALLELIKTDIVIAPAHVNRQRAGAVGALACRMAAEGKLVSAAEFVPEYLRKFKT